MKRKERKWQAEWIWGGEEECPRNEWRCFRRSFELPDAAASAAEIAITADARYVLFVNGTQCGRGPVRSWPAEQSYNTHPVEHLLRKGTNTIAVLVMSYGLSTFQYILGKGGLLAQLDVSFADGRRAVIGTDASWETAAHAGYDRRTPRMSCQLGFSESVDARLWDGDWTVGEKDSARWERARAIGKPGCEPWPKLVPSDIPPLTEEPLWPIRVESLKRVQPVAWTTCLDIRNAMLPDSVLHANHVSFVGYVAFVVRASEAADATFGFLSGFNAFKGIGVNGRRFKASEMEGQRPERYARVRLREGDNFVWIETAGTDHGTGLHFGIDSEAPFELVSPLADEGTESPFALIGPFAAKTTIDHLEQPSPLDDYAGFGGEKELDAGAFERFETYERFREAASAADLQGFAEWVRPFPPELVASDSVFGKSIWKRSETSHPVAMELQAACMAGRVPAIVPIYPDGDTEFVLDFGKEWSGYIRFELEAPEGAVLDFYGFEYMRDGWRQDTYILDNTLRYACKEGWQTYESPIRRGLRYLMVTVRKASRPVRLIGVQMVQSNFPVAEIGRFHSSDPLLNDIWEISKHTTRLCMEDTFVDCPAYEQTFWVGDSRNEALVNYYMFGASDIVKRCLELVPGSAVQTPLYADQVPSGWSSVIPNWTFFWANACLEYAEHTGDRAFAAAIWPKVRFTLEHYLQKIDDRGLLHHRGWNLLDWAPIDQPRNGVVTHQNAVFAGTLRAAAKLAELAGEAGRGKDFAEASKALAKAINEHLWSEEQQAYIDCIHADGRRSGIFSLQTQVIVYLNGVAEGDRKERLAGYLAQPPEQFVQIGSPFMAFFYYEALAALGRYDIMIDDMRKQFGQMIEYEATTCWEMYPDFPENRPNPNMLTRSHCHAWSAAPGYFLGACVLGVRKEADGWSRVRVSPQPGDLKWARGAVPLPGGGRIDVSWRMRDEGGGRVFELDVRAPEGVEVELSAPDGCESRMRLLRG
ncbi:family 78 glycoside hydrolase catalytic domain [Cohnella massiliensis]|uniref:family 78 glycoside hydrolase catalytic domain n=1 Tax=Cohnella massiliensis TaxID=1816691 RepID=UPI0009B99544|nr:family 78 glycoside hydrolase catalytic domain [Cohnella massiliensis]